MAKLTLSDIANALNDNSTISTINSNNALLEAALENTLSRDGTSPNTMSSNLDMNSYRIVNLPAPSANTDAARYQDVSDAVVAASEAADSASAAALSAAAASSSASSASSSASAAATSETDASTFASAASDSADEAAASAASLSDGRVIRYGAGSPSNGLGNDGDFYIDTTANYIYGPKASGTWPSGTSMIGPAGADGEMAGPGVSVDSEIALYNGITGTTLKRATQTGILKATSGVLGVATSSTDYAPATSGSSILKGNGTGGFSSAVASTDYAPATSGTSILKGNGSGGFSNASAGTDYQGVDSELTAIAGLTSAADKVPYFTGSGTAALADFTSAGRALVDDASASAQRTTLGLGTAATRNTGTSGNTVPLLDGANRYDAHQYSAVDTLTDGATISWDVSVSQKAKVTLAGNRTVNAVSNAVEGATYYLWVIQDATGSRTLSWTTTGAGSFDFGGAGAPTLTTTASKADIILFEAISIGGTLKLRFCGIAFGFA